MPTLLSLPEACVLFRVSYKTAWRKVTSGQWTAYKDGQWKVDPEEVLECIKSGGVKRKVYKKR